MILDLGRFVAAGRPVWTDLETMLDRLEKDPDARLDLAAVRRFHSLYRRTSADLARVATSSAEPDLRRYLESLVARAYGEVHEVRERPHRLRPFHWFLRTFPRTFRRHRRAFALAVAITLLGVAFGALALVVDPEAKEALLPFQGLQDDPAERVAREERAAEDPLGGREAEFSAFLMTHNTQVSILALALGATFGAGTCLLLFSNGVALGAVVLDYLRAGQGRFLAAWLLPHGSVEIPCILIAGQAGLVLGKALLGGPAVRDPSRADRGASAGGGGTVGERLREIGPDLVTLIGGCALLLVWAGLVEGFLSQVHEPVIPYAVKIAFGVVELATLTIFLALAGRVSDAGAGPDPDPRADSPGAPGRVPARGRAGRGRGDRAVKRADRSRTLTVRTPEGIVFALPLAGPVTRMLAWCVDALCIAVGSAMVSQLVARLVSIVSTSLAGAVTALIFFGVSVGYGMVLEWSLRGQTIGKRLLHIRVIDESALRLQPSQVVVRNLLRVVDALPVLYLVGGISCLVSRRAQRLGDIAGSTVVVHTDRVAEPDLEQVLPRKYNSFRDHPHLAARLRQKVGPEEAALALNLLLRRDELDDAARVALAGSLADHFRAAVPFPEGATLGLTDEQYLRNVVDVCFRGREAGAGVAATRRIDGGVAPS